MPKKKPFQVKFYSKSVHPDTIRMSDLAEVLKSIEAGIVSIAKDQSETDIFEDGIGLSLVSIKEGCAAIEIQSTHPNLIDPALMTFTRSIKRRQIDDLPSKAQSSISAIEDFSSKYHCNTHLRNNSSLKNPSAIIKQPRIIKLVEDTPLKGETTIYGRVESVGGARKPRVWIRLLDGERIGFDVNEEGATRFGKRIYKKIGLQGIAKWAANGTDILEFKLNEVIEYSGTPIDKAFEELSEKIGDHLEIENVSEFISEIRGD